jgi:hypothetical protein
LIYIFYDNFEFFLLISIIFMVLIVLLCTYKCGRTVNIGRIVQSPSFSDDTVPSCRHFNKKNSEQKRSKSVWFQVEWSCFFSHIIYNCGNFSSIFFFSPVSFKQLNCVWLAILLFLIYVIFANVCFSLLLRQRLNNQFFLFITLNLAICLHISIMLYGNFIV